MVTRWAIVSQGLAVVYIAMLHLLCCLFWTFLWMPTQFEGKRLFQRSLLLHSALPSNLTFLHSVVVKVDLPTSSQAPQYPLVQDAGDIKESPEISAISHGSFGDWSCPPYLFPDHSGEKLKEHVKDHDAMAGLHKLHRRLLRATQNLNFFLWPFSQRELIDDYMHAPLKMKQAWVDVMLEIPPSLQNPEQALIITMMYFTMLVLNHLIQEESGLGCKCLQCDFAPVRMLKPGCLEIFIFKKNWMNQASYSSTILNMPCKSFLSSF